MAPKKKKNKKRRRFITILVIIVVIIILLYACGRGTAAAAYVRENVERRDIRTYHSFSGTVKPSTEQNVYAEITGAKVEELLVSEGDEVNEGDALMKLDPSSIEDQIEQLETSMSVNAASSALSVQQARDNYENYKKDLNDGLNTQLMSAKQAVDSAETQMNTAQKNYEREIGELNAGHNQSIESAKVSVSTSYQQVRQAQISVETAQHSVNKADEDGATDEVKYQARKQLESAETSLNTAWLSYQNALTTLAVAEDGEDKTLTGYYDQFVSAQTAYLNAVNSYNATKRTVDETLANYKTQYEQAMLATDTSVNELQLKKLYEQLEDCTVRAPMKGVVTALNAKEGDMLISGTAAAVITDFDRMEVDIRINEYDIMSASVGEEVEITLNAASREYTGVISEISRVATVASGVSYFSSKVQFEADDDVRSGMSVEVRLITNDLHDVLTVNSRAVSTRDDGTAYVTVLGSDGSSQEERDVECGATDGTYIEILSGVKEGETVVYLPVSIDEIREQMMGM